MRKKKIMLGIYVNYWNTGGLEAERAGIRKDLKLQPFHRREDESIVFGRL